MINLKDMALFEKFIKLLAGRVGQVLNLSSQQAEQLKKTIQAMQ